MTDEKQVSVEGDSHAVGNDEDLEPHILFSEAATLSTLEAEPFLQEGSHQLMGADVFISGRMSKRAEHLEEIDLHQPLDLKILGSLRNLDEAVEAILVLHVLFRDIRIHLVVVVRDGELHGDLFHRTVQLEGFCTRLVIPEFADLVPGELPRSEGPLELVPSFVDFHLVSVEGFLVLSDLLAPSLFLFGSWLIEGGDISSGDVVDELEEGKQDADNTLAGVSSDIDDSFTSLWISEAITTGKWVALVAFEAIVVVVVEHDHRSGILRFGVEILEDFRKVDGVDAEAMGLPQVQESSDEFADHLPGVVDAGGFEFRSNEVRDVVATPLIMQGVGVLMMVVEPDFQGCKEDSNMIVFSSALKSSAVHDKIFELVELVNVLEVTALDVDGDALGDVVGLNSLIVFGGSEENLAGSEGIRGVCKSSHLSAAPWEGDLLGGGPVGDEFLHLFC